MSQAAAPPDRAEVVIDLDAVRHNVRVLREVAGVPLIVVVKADAYGHGMVPVARAAREAGAELARLRHARRGGRAARVR